MKWLILGGLALWAYSRRQTTTPVDPKTGECKQAGFVTWTGEDSGGGNNECITLEEAVKRSKALLGPNVVTATDRAVGEGLYWYR